MCHVLKCGLFLQIDNLDVQIAYPDLVKNDGELNKRVDGVSSKFSLKLTIHNATIKGLERYAPTMFIGSRYAAFI